MAEDENDENEWHIRFKQDEEMDYFTELALHEAERWIQAITRKKFPHPDDFRGSLANGVLLCELLNALKPGTVKRINKLPGAIAGLDNVNVFLAACKKSFGLNKTQLFDPGDLEDLSQRAIADESEYLLKQEVDRRARNVAITIYWLGRQVEGTFKGPSLDVSAFAALVHHQGNKNIISNECFKNENWQTTQTARDNYKDIKGGSHARDSSYDSLGSYEKESESSFDELETNDNMPVRDMRRYGSQSSLGKNENTRYSVANDSAFSDSRHDSLYQSSPELSQGSHAHTRSSSTDSMDGSYHGNSHSRQSSGSTDNYPTRLSSSSSGGRRTSTTTAAADPLQFVKVKGAEELAKTAAKQIEAAKETTLMRPVLKNDEGEPDWQSKLSGWKNRRKSASAAVYQRVGETEGMFMEEDEKPRTKTYSQITAEKEKRKSLGNLRSFYPMDDDDTFTTKLKLNDPLHIMKSEEEITQATEIQTKKKAKGEEVAPWARDSSGEGDSQSDSETNISHQSGDTDNVFSEQTISKVIHQDESWVKKRSSGGSQTSPTVRQTPPPAGNRSIKERNMQLWENSAKESQSKLDKKKVDIPAGRSINKIKDITKAFEEKENSAKAEPVITRRSEFGRKSWSFDSTESPFRRRSSDFSDKSDKSSPKGFNEKNVSPLLSPTSPKALLPKDQRPATSNFKYTSDYGSNKKFVEKTIKISQAPNNSRGFGFFVIGGSEKKEPVTVHKVSLGSSADISDVLANDELVSVNNHEVHNMTLKQVQGIIDHSVKRGQIELKIRRRPDEGSFDSLDEEGGVYLDHPGGSNKMDTQSDSSSFSTDPLSDDASYKTPQSSSRQTGSDDNEKPSLMDRLLAEKSREPNNNLDLSLYKSEAKEDKPPSPVAAENLKAEISFSSHMTPSRRSPVSQPKTEVSVGLKSEPLSEQMTFSSRVTPSRESPVNLTKSEVSVELKSESPSVLATETERDIISPDGDIVVEERQTISVRPIPAVEEEVPVPAMRRKRTPEKQRVEPVKSVETPPPVPPAAEPPSLQQSSVKSDDDDSGFGPPAALLRWQRPRAKSEYKNPYSSMFDQQVDQAKRLSATLPWRSSENEVKENNDVTKDDSVLTRVTKDFETTVAASKPPLTKSKTYHFDDASKLEEWDRKQEEDRQHEAQRPVTPVFEVEIRKEEKLTPQLSSKPGRKVGVPHLMDIPVTIPGKDETSLSQQEKFERDQQRIRLQYEEEKRRAREAEKQKEQQDQKIIKEDTDRLLHLESQIQPNKLDDIKPVYPPVQSKPPEFTSEPLTIKLPANSQGRQLVIDPRNREETGEAPLPQYTFHVDFKNQEDKPKLRTLNQEPELTAEELLERERERIREEEHRKFEEEKRRWKEEQDEQLRKEQERLKEEREAIAREKAKLEQKHEAPSRYQPVSINTYQSTKSPSGSTGSPSPKSPPPALDPHHRSSSGPSRKADIWAPPSSVHHTASKSDIGAKEKARLTREDLLAMNRKATPLQTMTHKSEDSEKEPDHITREPPSKLELHMLNSVPKPKFRSSAAWIKPDEDDTSAPTDKYADKQFVIGHRSDIIHKDHSNSQEHWVVQEAERRRLAENKDYSRRFDDSVHTAGPAKPSGSSLVNRFRGDVEPNRKNRYSYPAPRDMDSRPSSSRPLSTGGSGLQHFERSASPELSSTQFSARNQSLNFANPSLSNTLPANFSFNANKPPKWEPPPPAPKPQRTPTEQAEQLHTVSGKQKCSHCNEELGFGAAMVIESLGLYYHVQCFRCCVCRTPLGNGSEGADVRVRVNKLHCRNCFSNDEAGLKFSKV